MPEKNRSPDSPGPQEIMIGQTLRKTPMFADLPGETLRFFASGCELQTVPKGTYVFHEGETPRGFYVVHAGAVNVHRVTEEGREKVIRVFYPGESFAEVVLAGDREFPASARTTENSRLILVPTELFRRQLHRDPDLALRILVSMSLHFRYLVDMVEGLKFRQAEARVVQWLLRQIEDAGMAGESNPRLTLPLAKHLLASQLGITSETLSRVFGRLRELELLSIEGRELTFPSVSGMRRFLREAEEKAAGGQPAEPGKPRPEAEG